MTTKLLIGTLVSGFASGFAVGELMGRGGQILLAALLIWALIGIVFSNLRLAKCQRALIAKITEVRVLSTRLSVALLSSKEHKASISKGQAGLGSHPA